MQQFFVGVAQIANRALHALVLVLQRQRLFGTVGQADRHVLGRRVGDGNFDHPAIERVGKTEGWMRGQNDAGARPRPAFGKRLDGRSFVRGFFDIRREIFKRRCLVDVTDLLAKAARPANASAIHQPAGEGFHLVERHGSRFKPARQFEGDVQNRIERWVVRDLRSETLQFLDQLALIEFNRACSWRPVLH